MNIDILIETIESKNTEIESLEALIDNYCQTVENQAMTIAGLKEKVVECEKEYTNLIREAREMYC